MMRRGHSFTNFSPEEFREAYNEADTQQERAEVRETLRRIDDGRFYDSLEALHKQVAHYDTKRFDEFCSHNEWLIEWVSVYGLCEDLSTFPRR